MSDKIFQTKIRVGACLPQILAENFVSRNSALCKIIRINRILSLNLSSFFLPSGNLRMQIFSLTHTWRGPWPGWSCWWSPRTSRAQLTWRRKQQTHRRSFHPETTNNQSSSWWRIRIVSNIIHWNIFSPHPSSWQLHWELFWTERVSEVSPGLCRTCWSPCSQTISEDCSPPAASCSLWWVCWGCPGSCSRSAPGCWWWSVAWSGRGTWGRGAGGGGSWHGTTLPQHHSLVLLSKRMVEETVVRVSSLIDWGRLCWPAQWEDARQSWPGSWSWSLVLHLHHSLVITSFILHSLITSFCLGNGRCWCRLLLRYHWSPASGPCCSVSESVPQSSWLSHKSSCTIITPDNNNMNYRVELDSNLSQSRIEFWNWIFNF